MLKKFLSILISWALLLLVITVPAFATSSGSCGYNLTWTLDDEGVLTISGTGDMFSYETADRPWGDLTSLIVEEGVTSIGDWAFSWSSVASVKLPSSLVRIGEGAFSNSWLEKIVIPEGVKSIAEGAFEGCGELTEVTLPESLLVLEDAAFNGCDKLLSITIPGSVERIGDSCFSGCGGLTAVTIEKGVKYIDIAAFSGCYGLKSIAIPDGTEIIGASAFEDCEALADITLPDSLNYIDFGAFLNTALYNNEDNWTDGVLYIGNHVIKAKEDISGHYSIKEGTKTIATRAFYGCVDLTGVTFPDSVENINYGSFEATQITEISLPSSLVNIGEYAFYGLDITAVTIPNGVKRIDDYAFAKCTQLTDVTIPDSVEYIGFEVFEHSNIWSEEEWSAPNYMLYADNHLIYVTPYYYGSCSVREGTKTIAEAVFRDTLYTSVTLPSSVTRISESAFESCSLLEEVVIPTSVKSVGRYAFTCGKIYDDDTKWDDGVLYIENCLIEAEETISGEYSVKSGTRVIADYAFSERTHLTDVVFPDSVTDIGENAFEGCTNLTSVTIPAGIENINTSAFSKCKSLKDIYFGGSKSDWKKVNIEGNNEWLRAATVHFAVVPTLEWNAADETLTVSVTEGGNFVVIFANYEGEKLKALVPVRLTFKDDEKQTLQLPEGITANKMKAFLWNSFDDVIPLAKSVGAGWE